MIDDQKILVELRKINHNLEIQNSSFKRAGRAFSNGVFTALGYIFGTVVVAALIIYILSRLSFTKNLVRSLNDFTKKYSPSVQLSVPSPGQL
jgi:ABC-type glycerol-3-phosphate transport system permease component